MPRAARALVNFLRPRGPRAPVVVGGVCVWGGGGGDGDVVVPVPSCHLRLLHTTLLSDASCAPLYRRRTATAPRYGRSCGWPRARRPTLHSHAAHPRTLLQKVS